MTEPLGHPSPANPPLTGLERELLNCVERLTRACEDSTAQFAALEKRSTGGINNRLDALEACVSSLLESQISLTSVFATFAQASAASASLQRELSENGKALADAARRMSHLPEPKP
jgi:hypothetical protein